MSTMSKGPLLLLLSTVFVAGAAQAAVVDLGIGGANLYSLNNFTANSSDVEGAVLVGGNLTASSYSINQNNKDAYGTNGYALVVGGNLNYSSGSIKNGSYYVGGSTTTSSTGFDGASKSTTSPVSFASTSAQLKSTSTSLSTVAATGSSNVQYGGMTLTGGSGTGGVQVFNLTSSALGSVNYFNFSNLNANDTLILNISGSNVNLSGGYGNFGQYNVLYNFYEAQNITLNGVGLYGSILAPLATVSGGNGQINGNVVVGNWNSNIQVNSNHYFNPTNVAGLVSAVPEPETYAMLLAGLGMIGFMARRRKNEAV